jgi:hypothetical protein
MAKPYALYVESGQCSRRFVWFIGLFTPQLQWFPDLNFSRCKILLCSILWWQIIVIQGASGTLVWFALMKLIYAPLATRPCLWLWRLDRRVEVWLVHACSWTCHNFVMLIHWFVVAALWNLFVRPAQLRIWTCHGVWLHCRSYIWEKSASLDIFFLEVPWLWIVQFDFTLKLIGSFVR